MTFRKGTHELWASAPRFVKTLLGRERWFILHRYVAGRGKVLTSILATVHKEKRDSSHPRSASLNEVSQKGIVINTTRKIQRAAKQSVSVTFQPAIASVVLNITSPRFKAFQVFVKCGLPVNMWFA